MPPFAATPPTIPGDTEVSEERTPLTDWLCVQRALMDEEKKLAVLVSAYADGSAESRELDDCRALVAALRALAEATLAAAGEGPLTR